MSAAVKRQKLIYKKILIRDTHVKTFRRLELNLIDTVENYDISKHSHLLSLQETCKQQYDIIITLNEDLLHDLEAPDKIEQEIEN